MILHNVSLRQLQGIGAALIFYGILVINYIFVH
jgi:hypothetical protein